MKRRHFIKLLASALFLPVAGLASIPKVRQFMPRFIEVCDEGGRTCEKLYNSEERPNAFRLETAHTSFVAAMLSYRDDGGGLHIEWLRRPVLVQPGDGLEIVR
jgi:hypothetical protein